MWSGLLGASRAFMPVNRLLVPEGTLQGDWRRLGPFHFHPVDEPNTGFSVRTYEVWHDELRDALGTCHRATKTTSRITHVAEDSRIALRVRYVMSLGLAEYANG